MSWFAASLLLLPPEFEDFGRSLMASALSLSNVLFWSEAGYFAGPSEMKPLLHTWSLGVLRPSIETWGRTVCTLGQSRGVQPN